MYFWKIEALKEDVRQGRVTEKDRFIYAFVYIVFSAFWLALLRFSEVNYSSYRT